MPIEDSDSGDESGGERQIKKNYNKENEANKCIELDDDILEALGEKREEEPKTKILVHPKLMNAWKTNSEKDLEEETIEKLLDKYPVTGILETPTCNAEIKFTLSESGQKRDGYFMGYQKRIAAAAVALGTTLTTILNRPEGDFDVPEVIKKFSHAGKLMVGVQQLTGARIAVIEPGVTKPVKNVLKENRTGKFLFGEKLSEQFKEARAMEKIAQTFKKPQVNKTYKWPSRQNNLNWRGQYQRKPWWNHLSYSRGQAKQQ